MTAKDLLEQKHLTDDIELFSRQTTIKLMEEYHKAKVNEITESALEKRITAHEEYHKKGMEASNKKTVTIDWAVMCCGNSFGEGYEWFKEQLLK